MYLPARDLVIVSGIVAGATWSYNNNVTGGCSPSSDKRNRADRELRLPRVQPPGRQRLHSGGEVLPLASIGIKSTGGTITLDGVTVDSCMGGGIFLSDTTFDIENTTVKNNGPGLRDQRRNEHQHGWSWQQAQSGDDHRRTTRSASPATPRIAATGVYAMANTGRRHRENCNSRRACRRAHVRVATMGSRRGVSTVTDTREHIQFGPYLIVRLSGAGGMGRVEVALRADEKDPDVCVIKRLHGALHDEEKEARFRREAQIAARLEHENIARTLRIEKIDGELCIVQEFIEGVNLGKVMRQLGVRPLPIVVAVHVVSAVARALAYAHGFGRLGIVHRDVTPENVMLSFAGDVKLIDFGTARSAVDGRVTDTGVVVGRRSYVPPEAWEGEKVDHAPTCSRWAWCSGRC